MKIDWLLVLGTVCFLVFIITLFIRDAFWDGFGLALGLAGIVCIGASVGASVARKRRTR